MRYPMQPILPRMTPDLEQKFWSKVDRRGKRECWRYMGSSSRYGSFAIGRRTIAAHRVAWVLHNRKEMGDLLGCHSCDNRWCVNPHHIWLGTHVDNNRDTAAKGRHRNGSQYTLLVGQMRAETIANVTPASRSRIAKGMRALKERGYKLGAPPALTEAKAARMIAERKAGKTIEAVAAKYGVSTATVRNYVNRAKRRRYRK